MAYENKELYEGPEEKRFMSIPIDAQTYYHLYELSEAVSTDMEELSSMIIASTLVPYSPYSESEYYNKRIFPRKSVNIPAAMKVAPSENVTQYKTVMIQDMSISGAGLFSPKLDHELADEIRNNRKFEIIFTIPGTSTTIGMPCFMTRIISEKGYRIGAAFNSPSSYSLRKILEIVTSPYQFAEALA